MPIAISINGKAIQSSIMMPMIQPHTPSISQTVLVSDHGAGNHVHQRM